MSTDIFDPSLGGSNCIDSCEPICNNNGCNKFFALGPCSTIVNDINPATGGATLRGYVQPEDMIFDMASWCRVTGLNSLEYDPVQTVYKKGYVGDKFPTVKFGPKSPTIQVDVDFCRFDDSHCLLAKGGCYVGFVCVDNIADFNPAVSPTTIPRIRYGIAGIEAAAESTAFDQEDVRSFTLHISQYMWEFNMGKLGNTGLVAQAYETPKTIKAESES